MLVTFLCHTPETRCMACARPRPLQSCRSRAFSHTHQEPFLAQFCTVFSPRPEEDPHLSLTQRDGSAALRTAVVLAVQPGLGADIQLILSLVTDLGADTWFGDEVQALAVTAVITPCSRKYPSFSEVVQITTASPGLLHTHTHTIGSPVVSTLTQDFLPELLCDSASQRTSCLWIFPLLPLSVFSYFPSWVSRTPSF